jgi:hypothetical protein
LRCVNKDHSHVDQHFLGCETCPSPLFFQDTLVVACIVWSKSP